MEAATGRHADVDSRVRRSFELSRARSPGKDMAHILAFARENPRVFALLTLLILCGVRYLFACLEQLQKWWHEDDISPAHDAAGDAENTQKRAPWERNGVWYVDTYDEDGEVKGSKRVPAPEAHREPSIGKRSNGNNARPAMFNR